MSSLTDRALDAMRSASGEPVKVARVPKSAPASGMSFNFLEPAYPGVIASEGHYRVAVTPRGNAYVLQIQRGGMWDVMKWCGTSAILAAAARALAQSDALGDAAACEPADPRRSRFVPMR